PVCSFETPVMRQGARFMSPGTRFVSTFWIAFAGAFAHAVSTGLAYFGLSAYFPSFEREFGWSRTAIAGAFSMARVESGLLGPAEGYMTDRLGPRRVMYLGIVISALGFLGMSLVNTLPMLYVTIVVGIVLGSSIGFYIPVSVVVATLYRARRSLAFGIFRMGPGLSGLMVPLVGLMIVWWGWRAASVASAVIIVVMGWPLARAIGGAYERSAGLTETPASTPGRGGAATAPRPEVSLTLKEALRTRSFWFLAAVMGLRQMVTEGVSVHLVILLVDRGWRQEVAASLLGTSALIGVPARLAFGWMGDFIDKRWLMIGLLSALTASVLIMGMTTSPAWFMAGLVVYSLCYGGLASLQEAIRADYFGIRYFAQIQGYSRLFVTAGSVMGPIGAGFFYDLTHSYTVPLMIFAASAFSSTVLMFWTLPPARGQRKEQ
ncbi:MAG: MFS transporter, partial [Deltaproteobacteria bacterium]|nr:MFS transporter [Deltaproteobacteria bacterium]